MLKAILTGLLGAVFMSSQLFALHVLTDEASGTFTPSPRPLWQTAKPIQENLREKYNIPQNVKTFNFDASFTDYQVCFGKECKGTAKLGLHPIEEDIIRELFNDEVTSASEERQLISKAIGLFEYFSSRRSEFWTWDDKERSLDKTYSAKTLQLDSLDESSNTTTYLLILQNAGLIRFHKVSTILSVAPLIFNEHSSASIINIENDDIYAVDSWKLSNGYPALILPAKTWSQGKDRQLLARITDQTPDLYKEALKEPHIMLEIFE